MACTSGSLMVWKHSSLCHDNCTFVLGCCRPGSEKGSFYPLADHGEGWTPSHPAHIALSTFYGCRMWLIYLERLFYAFNASSEFQGSAAGQIFQAGGDHEAAIICCSFFRVLRDVSLKLWPNRLVLRTFSPSSSDAALSETQTLAAAPEIQWASLQNEITPPASASLTEIYVTVLIQVFTKNPQI